MLIFLGLFSSTAEASSFPMMCISSGFSTFSSNSFKKTNYFFENTQINSHLVEHFAPLVSPEKVLKMGQVN